MRQGNGTDLLGNDPRSASIGIIYVSPTDDRKSVLAALITQEKFQRKQVAIVLPPGPNKAFQRPVDFDDLKNVRRKLQTEIVFIAPSGPGPAEFARQRRFPVYSSLESYAKALREDQSLGGSGNIEKKGGGIFGLGRPKSPAPGETTDEKRLPAPPVEPNIAQQRGQRRNATGAALAGAAAGAAAVEAANLAMQGRNNNVQNAQIAQNTPTVQNMQTPMDVQARGNNAPGAPSAPFEMNDDSSELPPPPMPVPLPNSSAPVSAGPNTMSSQPNGSGPMGANPGPNPIELSPVAKRGKQTVKLPIAGPPPEAVAPVPAPIPVSMTSGSNKVPPHNTGKMASAGAGVAAGAATRAAMTNRGGGVGVGTSPRTNANRSNPPNNRPKPRRRGGLLALLAALLLLALLLTCVGFAYLQPTTFASVLSSVKSVVPNLAGTTTVTVIPASQIVSHSYVISAVTGTPDPNQRQVKAYPLSYTTPPKSVTVNTTGVKNIDAKSATGQVTFTSGLSTPYTFGTTTAIPSASGVNFFLVQPVTIPAANIGVSFGTATGTARAATPGAVGNIPAGNINTVNNSIRITNPSPFTGGQDAQHYHYVTQSDITNAAQPLKTTLMQEAQSKLKAQATAGQALASGTQCTPNVSSDHPVGATNVDTVTVTVSETCTAEAYDAAGLQSLVKTLLDQQVAQDPNLGKGYTLQGQVVTDTTIESIKNGTVFLNVNAKGLYAYAALDKTQLANLIKGKPADQALALLKSQPHVKDASLPSGVTTLPTDVSQITIVIQMPQGFTGGGTTTGGNPTPTSVTGNG